MPSTFNPAPIGRPKDEGLAARRRTEILRHAIIHFARSCLAYFDAHPQYVELLIQERAVFPGREKATYFEHKDANRGRWLLRFQEMMNHGTLRQMPAERALDVIGDLLYGTIF